MDIEVQVYRQYRSYRAGLSVSGLNNLVVLTGSNGSGKTQLLQIIERKSYISQSSPQATATIMRSGIQIDQQKIMGIFDWTMPPAQAAGAGEMQNWSQEIYNDVINKLPPNRPGWNQRFSQDEHLALLALAEQFAREGYSREEPPTIDNVIDRLPSDFDRLSSQIVNERIASIIFNWHFARVTRTASGGDDPIDIFNQLCEEFDTEYRLPALERYDTPYQAQLVNPQGDRVQWNELSSGEQILFRIICWLFYYRMDKAVYPEIMLLDEPDAHLTPKMIHRFLNNVKDTLVDKLGIAVILTTHSPNMIALCEEPALYELTNNAGTRTISSITRKEALEKFAEGLLFVQAENKLVFVEGVADRDFYTALHQIAISAHSFRSIPGLAFIPASINDASHGGVTQVTQMIPRFASTSLESLVYGLIDRDNGNQSQPKIAVIDRYAIENYIYDPLIIAVNLINNNRHGGIISESYGIGVGEYSKVFETPQVTQAIVDEIVAHMATAANPVIEASGHSSSLVDVEWLLRDGNVASYKLPRWIIDMKKAEYAPHVIHAATNPFKNYVDNGKQLVAIQTLGAIPMPIIDIFRGIQDNTI